MRPPFSFWSCPKRECAAPGGREKSAGRTPVQWPSVRTGVGVSVQAPIWACLRARLGLLRVCSCRPVADSADLVGVVVVLALLLFSLPLAVLHGSVSGSGERRRMYPCTSPGQRFPQGQRVSVSDRREGPPTFPRRRQEVCASADLLPPAGDSWLSLAAVRNGNAMPLGKLPVRGGLGYILRRFSLPLARWLMDASATGR